MPGFGNFSRAGEQEIADKFSQRKTMKRSNLSAEWLPSRIERGQFDGEIPKADDVEYVVYSFWTVIAWVLKTGEVVIPEVRYSQTTTGHQRMCRLYL